VGPEGGREGGGGGEERDTQGTGGTIWTVSHNHPCLLSFSPHWGGGGGRPSPLAPLNPALLYLRRRRAAAGMNFLSADERTNSQSLPRAERRRSSGPLRAANRQLLLHFLRCAIFAVPLASAMQNSYSNGIRNAKRGPAFPATSSSLHARLSPLAASSARYAFSTR